MMANDDDLTLFALGATREFSTRVANRLSLLLGEMEERSFEDGEHKSRPLVNVRDRDVFVIQSLYSDAEQSVNDKLVRLLFFIGALHDASARRITAVIPYLAYARKDRKTQTRDPVTSRYMAQIIEAVGTDRILTLDVHNLAAYQNAFRIHADHLEALPLFVAHFAAVLADEERISVISPDIGGAKRADRFRIALQARLGREIAFGFMEKARARGRMTAGQVYGGVAGRGARTVDGLGMLLHQGAAAFAQWTGQEPPVAVMRAALMSSGGR